MQGDGSCARQFAQSVEVHQVLLRVSARLSEHATAGNAHAADLLAEWEAIIAGIATKKLARLPGLLRGKLAASLEERGFQRDAKVECAVLLDNILRQLAEEMPGLVAKRTGTLGGVAVKPTGNMASVSSNLGQGEDLALLGASGFVITTRSLRGQTQDAMKEFAAFAGKVAPQSALKGVRCSNGILFFTHELQHAGVIREAFGDMFTPEVNSGAAFLHCARVWPLQVICEDSVESVAKFFRELMPPLLGESATPTTFAIRNEGGALHRVSMGLNAALAQLADVVPGRHEVNLRQPAVLVQLRGFALGSKRWCGISISSSNELPQAKSGQDFSEASAGYSYYRAGVNSGSGREVASANGHSEILFPDENAFEAFREKLIAAVRRADLAGEWFRSCGFSEDVASAPTASTKKAKARMKQSARDHQVRAMADAFESSALTLGSTATIEYGAGSGVLTDLVRQSMQKQEDNVVSVLVDRDCKLPMWAGKRACWSTSSDVHCVRIDIRNLWLSGLSKLSGRRVVGIGKHVCGVATDLALRSLCSSHLEGSSGSVTVGGVGIALCCRHLCTWEDYVDHSWVLDSEFSPQEFRMIAHLSSWAHQQHERRRHLGRACKRFLDAGRVRFLRRQGFRAIVQDYVDAACTQENQLLLAWREDREMCQACSA